MPNPGDVVELEIDRIAYGGDGVGRHEGMVYFVPLAASGDRLRVRVTEVKSRFVRAAIEQILTPSPSRRDAPCPLFGDCGGCQLQHLTYPAQLNVKAEFIRDALQRIGHIDWADEIVVHSAAEFGYRGRAQIKVQPRTESRPLAIGFNRLGSRAVRDVESCPILLPELGNGLTLLRFALQRQEVVALYEVEIAVGDNGFATRPEITGLPSGKLQRAVGPFTYQFTPSTFFQSNPLLVHGLVSEATEGYAGALALDLFAGVGLFTLPLARTFKRVVGVESDPAAIGLAQKNLAKNGIANADLCPQSVSEWLAETARSGDAESSPDFVLLDPPRTGAASAIDSLLKIRAPKLVYVSCDPTTMARDLARLTTEAYKISRVVAFDMFPQTYHVECVTHLSLR